MRILRIGSTHGSPTRYLDVLKNPEIEHITWLTHEDDIMVKRVFQVCNTLEDDFSNKFKLVTFKKNSLAGFWIRVLNFLANRRIKLPLTFDFLLILITNTIFYFTSCNVYRKALKENVFDFVWSGNNDSDGVNYAVWAVSLVSSIKIIHAYQEHRCSYRIDEKIALRAAHHLILPSKRNLLSFEATYNLDLERKTSFGNEDWRSLYLIENIENIPTIPQHLHCEPSLIILARFATYGSNSVRRGSRVNYVRVMEELASRGVHVHLNCLKIVEDLESMHFCKNNPYSDLKEKYPHYVHIDTALNLDDLSSYGILKSYTAGLLHNFVADEEINSFSEMNVPNRFFEYLICNVLPVVKKNTLKDAEDLINSIGFGVIYENYDELAYTLKDIEKTKVISSIKKRYSFLRFTKILVNGFNFHCKYEIK